MDSATLIVICGKRQILVHTVLLFFEQRERCLLVRARLWLCSFCFSIKSNQIHWKNAFFVLVVAVGIVFAVPLPAPVPVPDVNLPTDGGDSNRTDNQVCRNPDDVACFFQVNDPRRNGAINTKVQSEPYETYYQLRCSRAQKFDSLYTLAEDQTSDSCRDAINFSDLS